MEKDADALMDQEERNLVYELKKQIPLNQIKVSRINGILKIEQVYAIFALIAALFISVILLLAILHILNIYLVNIDMSFELFLAIILPFLLSLLFSTTVFFVSTLSRIHELRQLKNWNCKALDEAFDALRGY